MIRFGGEHSGAEKGDEDPTADSCITPNTDVFLPRDNTEGLALLTHAHIAAVVLEDVLSKLGYGFESTIDPQS